MIERKTWARRLAEDPVSLLAFNAPPDQVGNAQPASGAPALQDPPMEGLYVAPSETDLPTVVQALQTGDTTGLPADLAREVTEARNLDLFRNVKLPGHNGDMLDAGLWMYRDGKPRPAIVMPSPWAAPGWLVYAIQGLKFALRGYNVLAYSARGFGKSGGKVEVAGKADLDDGIKALDFLIHESQLPPTKVGFLGDSYGSGISQMVAALDHRVDAVVALSTWGDLGQAFYENDTRHLASVEALRGAVADDQLSDETRKIFDDVRAGENIQQTLTWAKMRSPLYYIEDLNARKVPIFFAHAWHETLFPTNQTLEMFNRLKGPKRLDLSIGDHSGPEMTGVIGLPNRIWTDAYRWFDHYLKAESNGIDTEGQVVSQIMWNWSGGLETKASWETVTKEVRKQYLTAPAGDGSKGDLANAPSTGWNMALRTGINTVAEVATKIIETGFWEMLRLPKVYKTSEILGPDAVIWSTPPASTTWRLRGIPRLHVTFGSMRACTFIAYLFDADAKGNARIITHAPFTAPSGTNGKPTPVNIKLQATGYDLPDGHRLMLVIDSKDKFYSDDNVVRPNTITISSPPDDPSYLDVPLG